MKLSKVSSFRKTEYSPIPFHTKPSNNCLTFGKSLTLSETVNYRHFVTLNHEMRGRVVAKKSFSPPMKRRKDIFLRFHEDRFPRKKFRTIWKNCRLHRVGLSPPICLRPTQLVLTLVRIKIQLNFDATLNLILD